MLIQMAMNTAETLIDCGEKQGTSSSDVFTNLEYFNEYLL